MKNKVKKHYSIGIYGIRINGIFLDPLRNYDQSENLYEQLGFEVKKE